MAFINGLSAIGIVIVVALAVFGGFMLWAWISSSGESDAKKKYSIPIYSNTPCSLYHGVTVKDRTNTEIYNKIDSLEKNIKTIGTVFVVVHYPVYHGVKVFSNRLDAVNWIFDQGDYDKYRKEPNAWVPSDEIDKEICTEKFSIEEHKIDEELNK